MEELKRAVQRGDERAVRRAISKTLLRPPSVYHLAASAANAGAVVCALIANGWRIPAHVTDRAYRAAIHPVAVHYQGRVQAQRRVVRALLALAQRRPWVKLVAMQAWALRYEL